MKDCVQKGAVDEGSNEQGNKKVYVEEGDWRLLHRGKRRPRFGHNFAGAWISKDLGFMSPYIQGVLEFVRFVPHFRILNDPTEIAGVAEIVSTRRRRCALFRPVDHLNMRRKQSAYFLSEARFYTWSRAENCHCCTQVAFPRGREHFAQKWL